MGLFNHIPAPALSSEYETLGRFALKDLPSLIVPVSPRWHTIRQRLRFILKLNQRNQAGRGIIPGPDAEMVYL